MNNSNTDQKKKPDGIITLKKLLPYLSDQKGLVIVGTLSTLVSIAISLGFGFAVQLVIDGFPSDIDESVSFLNDILLLALGAIITLNLVQFLSGYCLEKVAVKITENIRGDIFRNIVNQKIEYVGSQSSGDMQTRIVADTGAVGGFLANQIPTIVTSALMIIGGTIGAIYISSKLTLSILFCVPFIFLPFLIFSARLRKLGEMVRTAISEIGRFSGEVFRNIKVVQAYGNEDVENKKFEKYIAHAVVTRLKTALLQIGLNRTVEALATIGFAFLLWSAANDIYNNVMTIGELIAFAYFALLIVRSAASFFSILTSINIAVGTAKKVLEYLDLERHPWSSHNGKFSTTGKIDIEDLSFCYPSRPENAVLKNLKMQVSAGSKVALVGPSGSGKSTLFELLLKFYSSYQGRILIDDVDIVDIDKSQLRSSIGYVPQVDSLISGNIYENIAYGIECASEEVVINASKLANAHEFIAQLPKGYYTDIGEVGSKLSGGQKQRICLARALIRNPKILLLDEAKSALDSTSERIVTQAIENWSSKNNATVLSITHSLSAVKNSDLIVVMNNGEVVSQGTHQELIESSEVYNRLLMDEFNQNKDESIDISELVTS